MGERAHLSIGEVLSLVQEDFPDITISKIRFLESQGLLDPERTPSGYRKFYDADIDRLEWILTQQRDHFLPLKVIRERLAEWDATGTRPTGNHQSPPADQLPGATHDSIDEAPVDDVAAPADPVPADPEPTDAARAEVEDDASSSRRAASSLAAASAIEVTPPPAAPAPAPAAPAADPPPVSEQLRMGPDDTALTADELADRAGVDVRIVHELEGFSMIESRRVGPDSYFDVSHLPVVQACRAFLDHGVEVRHLRMYKIAAEREAGVLEQLIMPLLKQRNPEAKARAVDMVAELAEVGEELHAALLRRALRQTLP